MFSYPFSLFLSIFKPPSGIDTEGKKKNNNNNNTRIYKARSLSTLYIQLYTTEHDNSEKSTHEVKYLKRLKVSSVREKSYYEG